MFGHSWGTIVATLFAASNPPGDDDHSGNHNHLVVRFQELLSMRTSPFNVHVLPSPGLRTVVMGGYDNKANASYSSVDGGMYNVADGVLSEVAGGSNDNANGQYSEVSGGFDNKATGIEAVLSLLDQMYLTEIPPWACEM